MDVNASAIWLMRALKPKKAPERCFHCLAGGPRIDSSRVASAALTLRAPSLRSRVHIAGAICRTLAGILIPVLKQKSTPRGAFIVWRWARDSNPGNLSVQRFSRPPLSTTQPAHLNLSRLPSREAPHYSDASLTIKLPVRYFPRNLCLLQLPLLEHPAGRLRPSQGYSRFSPRLGTLLS